MIGSRRLAWQPVWPLVLAVLLLLAIVGSRALSSASPLTMTHRSVVAPAIAAPAAATNSQTGSMSSTQRTITASPPKAPDAAAPTTNEQPSVGGPPGTAQCPPQPRSGRPCAAPCRQP